jgi:hypothetical protein
MLLTQGVVNLVLEWNVRMHFAKPDRGRIHFHIQRYRRSVDRGHGASVGFCGTTCEAVPAPSLEIERKETARMIKMKHFIAALSHRGPEAGSIGSGHRTDLFPLPQNE